MRIDKFLKASRLIKRRTVAQQACQTGRVLINQKVAKPSTTVAVGDTIEIRFAAGSKYFQVLALPYHPAKDAGPWVMELDGTD